MEALSSTHNFVQEVDGDDLLLSYKPDNGLLLLKNAKDVILTLRKNAKSQGSDVHKMEQDGQNYIFARLRPKITGEVKLDPRQWVFLYDASGSREKIEAQAQAFIIERFLNEADDNDTFNIIAFNTEATAYATTFGKVREADGDKITAFLSSQKLLGASDIENVLKQTAKLISNNDLNNPVIVFLGDGIATEGLRRENKLVKLLAPSIPVVAVCFKKYQWFNNGKDRTVSCSQTR